MMMIMMYMYLLGNNPLNVRHQGCPTPLLVSVQLLAVILQVAHKWTVHECENLISLTDTLYLINHRCPSVFWHRPLQLWHRQKMLTMTISVLVMDLFCLNCILLLIEQCVPHTIKYNRKKQKSLHPDVYPMFEVVYGHILWMFSWGVPGCYKIWVAHSSLVW